MSPEFLTVAMFATLILAICLGHPLAYTLAAIATLFGLIDNGFNLAGLFNLYANNTWGSMNNYVLVAIPLFILMAQLLDQSKVSDKLFEALYVVLGGIKGGLGLAVVKKIIEEHGGTLELLDAPVFDEAAHFGAMARIVLPFESEARKVVEKVEVA